MPTFHDLPCTFTYLYIWFYIKIRQITNVKWIPNGNLMTLTMYDAAAGDTGGPCLGPVCTASHMVYVCVCVC